MTVEALLRRAPTAAVFGPRDDPTFRSALAGHLRALGFATYELAMGPTTRDSLHAARATPPDTALVFVDYAPGAFHLTALLAAVLRWKAQRRFVVICRGAGAFASAKQRLAYAAVRAIADVELAIREPAALIGTWPRGHLPRPSWLTGVWPRRRAESPLAALLRILRCPECRGSLAYDEGGLRCRSCGRIHPIVDGIPILVPEGVVAQVEEDEHAYAAGDAYACGAEANRAWLEIGLWKRDRVAALLRRGVPRASIDVGCGDWGVHHDVFDAVGSELAVAGDVSLKLVRHARDHATAPHRVHYLVFSAETLPFADGIFDLAYCSEVLEHLEHPERALAEIARVARGGRAILTVPNEQVTGKLEAGHIQTFGFDDFTALVDRFLERRRTLGVFRWAVSDVGALSQTLAGTIRLKWLLLTGERAPRRSLSILVDGRLRP
ncbi:MAG: class I SAM-dependent methyltransferase [Chloroflexota bacterium]|nr:class I SAM-dependent methyltransferase [Chloroflexota bacterium]